MWGILQDKLYKTCMTDLDDLKHRIRAQLDHTVVAAVVHQWRRRLSGCVKAGGGHFEHFFDLDVVFAAINATFLAVVDRFCLILMGTGNYSATSNNMKLVHWPLMCGLLHLVQR